MELIEKIRSWQQAGHSVLLATVIHTWKSAPCKVGSKMAFTDRGLIYGAVSGGCIEGAVIEEGQRLLKKGSARRLDYGVSDELAGTVGLACGGGISIWLEKLSPTDEWFSLDFSLRQGLITALDTGQRWIHPNIPLKNLPAQSQIFQDEGREYFVDWQLPSPALMIIGASQIALSLVKLAQVLEYPCTILDPRSAFATQERFPEAKVIIHDYADKLALSPHMAVIALSHDPKIDEPALIRALASDVFYIGALGGRISHEKRLQRLRAAGFSAEQLARIHSPIGLAIGAESPEEIALCILAEVLSVYKAKMQKLS